MNLPDTARVAPLPADDPRSQDPLLEDLVNFVGYRPNALLTMARKPGVLPAVLALVQNTLRGDGLIEPSLRFLLAAEACRGARCLYSTVHVVHAAQHAGVTWAQLAALPDYRDSADFNERERAALRIASAGATLPVADAAPAFELARQQFSEDELLEIVSIVAAFGWFNRWNSLMQTTMEPVPAEALHHVGWLQQLMKETTP
ncbi:carboxymuconolactone decarboxylase family protein [Hydrogenophaga sp.]|uniref:carboxymuconolactone decarboxylase family protein n=1 Tax=Hydrogenophaga sp. TaxID=1904254 RepID=UPI0035636376